MSTLTDDQRKRRNETARARYRQRMANETPEERAERCAYRRLVMSLEAPEERERRLAMQRRRNRRYCAKLKAKRSEERT